MLAAFLGILLATAQLPPPVGIEVTQGEVDGLTGWAFWPSERPDEEPTSPLGYKVHLHPVEDLDRELLFSAGVWFKPPRGQYVVWLEGAGKASWTSNVISVADSPFRGSGRAAVFPVGDAGSARVVSPFDAAPDRKVRFVHLESHNQISEFPQEEFSRRVPLDSPDGSVTLPVGRAVAGVFSKTADSYLALSRPFAVEKRKESVVEVSPPADTQTDVMLLLERAEPARSFKDYDLSATLTGEGWAKPADILIPTARRVYAIWYGLPAGGAQLSIASAREFLPEKAIVLRPGKIERQVFFLERKPTVKVRLELPELLRQATDVFSLEVKSSTTGAPLRKSEVGKNTQELLLEALPPLEMTLVLRAQAWVFRLPIDLRDGADQETTFQPLGTAVSGRVLLGDAETPAEISFSTDLAEQKSHDVATDEFGHYETWLWRQGTYLVAVRWPGRAEKFRQVVEIPPVAETLLDLKAPGALYRVRAIDRRTRQTLPISRAHYSFEAEDGQSSSLSLAPSAEVLDLPPLPAGKLAITVMADGYRERTLADLEIAAEGDGRTFTIELEKLNSVLVMKLLQANTGRPAQEAEIRVQEDLGAPEATWTGAADEAGYVRVPAELAGQWALVRDPQAAVFWDRLPQIVEDGPIEWRLPPATSALSIRVVDADDQPVARAEVAIGFGSAWLSGVPLAWLTRSRAVVADSRGIYRAEGLPPTALYLLARREPLATRLDELAPLASKVEFPRPTEIVLRVLPN